MPARALPDSICHFSGFCTGQEPFQVGRLDANTLFWGKYKLSFTKANRTVPVGLRQVTDLGSEHLFILYRCCSGLCQVICSLAEAQHASPFPDDPMPSGGAADTPLLPHLPNAGTSPAAVFWTVWWLLELRGPHALQPTNRTKETISPFLLFVTFAAIEGCISVASVMTPYHLLSHSGLKRDSLQIFTLNPSKTLRLNIYFY